MGRRPQPVAHGTRSGYDAHKRRGERPCQPCFVAVAAYVQRYRQRGRCAPGLGWPLEARRG